MKNKLFESMLRIRLVEESIADKYSEQKMRCPTHLSIGQEAIAVGVCANLTSQDQVLSTHRAHAHYLAKGGCLNSMMAEIYGKASGCSKGMGGSMHLIDTSVGFMGSTAIVGNTIPVAVGLALEKKLTRKKSIACVFFGDGATEEGAFYESVNFAIIHSLPILFICENNLYSVYSGLEVRQPVDRKIYKMVSALGISAQHGNGNDVEEVARKVKHAKTMILKSGGPQFLEFDTYRWREHCGPNFDNNIGYREESEFLKWKKKDPLKNFYSENSQKYIDRKIDTISREIDDAHQFADDSKFPTLQEYNAAFQGT
ncbi:thiamine pyrophosphate-dependent dehydrogenase E1 component subunit alpha [Gammaproteobacteria bacterium]|nr:thiamine pyrophosphate-dependent dehydrogenase E1 component subunit alpha [Gammaproteobacteria bacterium]